MVTLGTGGGMTAGGQEGLLGAGNILFLIWWWLHGHASLVKTRLAVHLG